MRSPTEEHNADRPREPKPNAFDPAFLDRFGAEDQPPSTEADTAGPWRVESAPGGWGVFAEGEDEPEAVFAERELALLAAAALPASGAADRFHLQDQPERPYPVRDHGQPVGTVRWWRDDLIQTMSHLSVLARSPASMAYLLEASGAMTLERTGRVLQHRVAARAEAGER